jgi:hypothetical protein
MIYGETVLNEVCNVDGLSVYVQKNRNKNCNILESFFVDDLFFVLFENGHWCVDCQGQGLGSDGDELKLILPR